MEQNDSSKKTLVLAAGLYPPDVGGPATYAAMLATELPDHGYDVTVVPFHSVRSYPKVIRHVVYTWRLWRATPAGSCILALDGVSVGLPALLVSRLRRAPFFVRLGGDFAWEQGRQRFGVTATLDEFTATSNKQYSLPVRVLSWLQAVVVRRARCVIVPSHYLASIVQQWPRVLPERVEVVYSVLHPLPIGAPAVSHSQFTLLTAGRLVPWKGMSELLEVLQVLPKEVVLRIAGDGPQRAELEQKVQALALTERVTFLGQLSRADLRAEKVAADIFVLNTSYEGLSHELLEVMDVETPIVATSVGGNPELITHNETGLLVTPNDTAALADAVEELRTQPKLSQTLAAAAKQRTHQFTSAQSLQTLQMLLHKYGA